MHLLDTALTPSLQQHTAIDSTETLITGDQERITALLERYRNGPRDSTRVGLLEQICARLVLHLAIGDQLLCPLVRELQVAGRTLDEISIGHYVIQQLIRRLQDGGATDRQRDALVTALADYLAQYFDEERDALLPPLRYGPINADELEARIRAEKRRIAPWLGIDENDA